MATVVITNQALAGTSNTVKTMWHLTRVMKKAGWNVVAHSDGTTKTSAGTNANDSWGNNSDPLLDSYPSGFDSAYIWIVMQGPSTLKIPLNNAPSGAPLRGETVTQSATGAEGELLGYVWDSSGMSGWMVVAPRVGTFNVSTDLVGSTSSASLTPTGTIVTYVREFMFSKVQSSNNYDSNIYYICADVSGESAQLYSALASSAGCTATVPPGSGGTSNSFPTLGLAIRGAGDSATTTGGGFMASYSSGYVGSYHAGCVNATVSSGVTADGSFYVLASNSNLSGILSGWIFTRVDDQDPGDVDPYVICHVNGGAISSSWTRLSSTSYGSSPAPLAGVNQVSLSSYSVYSGYQARGCPVTARDIPIPYTAGGSYSSTNGNTTFHVASYPSVTRLVNHPATTPPMQRESVLIHQIGAGVSGAALKHVKGRCRWIQLASQGSALDTADNKSWICVSSVTSNYAAILIGPWDGSTTPSA